MNVIHYFGASVRVLTPSQAKYMNLLHSDFVFESFISPQSFIVAKSSVPKKCKRFSLVASV